MTDKPILYKLFLFYLQINILIAFSVINSMKMKLNVVIYCSMFFRQCHLAPSVNKSGITSPLSRTSTVYEYDYSTPVSGCLRLLCVMVESQMTEYCVYSCVHGTRVVADVTTTHDDNK